MRSVGARALLVEVADAEEALALALWARRGSVPAGEIVPAACSVLFDDVDPDALARSLLAGDGRWRSEDRDTDGALVTIAVTYDGDDLERVAELWDCSVDEVVERHTGTDFRSAFCGFAPGFAYLTGLPEQWHVPRLATPRTRVPAGSVALAGSWCGVYPTTSPGGWLLLGRTDVTLWDPDAAEPALLSPGTRVRFVAT